MRLRAENGNLYVLAKRATKRLCQSCSAKAGVYTSPVLHTSVEIYLDNSSLFMQVCLQIVLTSTRCLWLLQRNAGRQARYRYS
jgi:hypothetical protein